MYTYRSFGPLLDTSAIRGENIKHSDYKKGTSPTTGVARPFYTTVSQSEKCRINLASKLRYTFIEKTNRDREKHVALSGD